MTGFARKDWNGRHSRRPGLKRGSPLSKLIGAAAAIALASLNTACSPLSAFATFVPKDPAVRVARGARYGPDPRQTLDVYAPKGGVKDAPVAVFFYGGAWNTGRRQDYNWVGRALAGQGFVAVVADYRLYPQVAYPAFLDDGAQAVRWSADHVAAYGGDPANIALIGHSAGAYNAVMLALDPEYLRAAGVDPGRVRAVAGLAGPYDFLPLDDPATVRTFGKAADLAATQPVSFARAGAPAAFLATGEDDKVVYPRNTHRLAARLRAAGAPVEEKTYPGVDHVRIALALAKPFRKRLPVLADMTAFLRAHMR